MYTYNFFVSNSLGLSCRSHMYVLHVVHTRITHIHACIHTYNTCTDSYLATYRHAYTCIFTHAY